MSETENNPRAPLGAAMVAISAYLATWGIGGASPAIPGLLGALESYVVELETGPFPVPGSGAEEILLLAIDEAERLPEADSRTAELIIRLARRSPRPAWILTADGTTSRRTYPRVEALLRRAVASIEAQPDATAILAEALYELGRVVAARRRSREAATLFVRALKAGERSPAKRSHLWPNAALDLAALHGTEAHQAERAQDFLGARRHFQRKLAFTRTWVRLRRPQDPEDFRGDAQMSWPLADLAKVEEALGEYGQAARHLKRAISLQEATVSDTTSLNTWKVRLVKIEGRIQDHAGLPKGKTKDWLSPFQVDPREAVTLPRCPTVLPSSTTVPMAPPTDETGRS